MARHLPTEYVLQVFYSYCRRPKQRRGINVHNAECPICGEGRSAGKKKRLFYYPDEHYLYCFNCTQSWSDVDWVSKVTHKTYREIYQETEDGYAEDLMKRFETTEEVVTKETPILPPDCVDITDDEQVDFYASDPFKYQVLQKAISVCKDRRLYTAINRSKSYFVSFEDYSHKNRLIIPFYDRAGKIASYQSRLLFETADYVPKYLTKLGNKTLFGEDKVSADIPYLFIFEGPIDAMFVKNAVALGGTSVTDEQQGFINNCLGYEKVFVYDNDKGNDEMKKRIEKTIKAGERVFVWPPECSKYKDVNAICCGLSLDEIPWKFFLENSFKGIEALVKSKLSQS